VGAEHFHRSEDLDTLSRRAGDRRKLGEIHLYRVSGLPFGKFYAFYATRLIDANGKVNEQLSYAISDDGIHFVKQKPNPFYTSAPGYSKRNFRDPKAVVDADGVFTYS